jgi:ATP-binding cassette subfamily C protein
MPLSDFLKSLNILDPKKVKVIFEEQDNTLKIVVDGKVLSGLIPAKPFPITHPEFIIFRDSYGADLCIIKNYKELDDESIKNLKRLLDKIYFIPRILKIKKIETSGDEFLWDVLTDKGPRKFRTRGRMSVTQMGNRIVITDINDNVYEIEDIYGLDAESISEIEMTI